MKPRKFFSVLLVFVSFFLCTANALAEDVQIPQPTGDIYVQDFAQVLSGTEKTELVNLGKSIEDQTTAQVAVLTVQTIGNQTIEEFSTAAFRQYGIGSKKQNNGVLLVLAIKERKVRIEVGYGLEGRITDGKAGRILDEKAVPYLKNGQPNQAVVKTYKALANEVKAEYGKGNTTKNGQQADQDKGIKVPPWLIAIVITILVILDFTFFGGTLTRIILMILFRGGRGGGGGSRGGGGGSSGGGGAGRGW